MSGIKTFIVLLLAGGLQIKIFVSPDDLSHLDGLSLTTSAQPTVAEERRQDELFARFYRYDDATNQNVPALRELPEFHGLPEPANHSYKVIRVREWQP